MENKLECARRNALKIKYTAYEEWRLFFNFAMKYEHKAPLFCQFRKCQIMKKYRQMSTRVTKYRNKIRYELLNSIMDSGVWCWSLLIASDETDEI